MGWVYRLGLCVGVSLWVGCDNAIPWDGSETPKPSDTPPGSSTLYSSDFEADDGGFTVSDSGGNSSWEWGEPISGPGIATSGSRVWGTNLSGNYQDNDYSCIVSPTIDLTTGQPIALHFQISLDTEWDYDYWSLHIADEFDSFELDYGSGGDGSWQLEEYDLTPVAGQSVRIELCLESDEGVRDDGVFVDDVAVYELSD